MYCLCFLYLNWVQVPKSYLVEMGIFVEPQHYSHVSERISAVGNLYWSYWGFLFSYRWSIFFNVDGAPFVCYWIIETFNGKSTSSIGSCNYSTVSIILCGSMIMRKYKEKAQIKHLMCILCATFCCLSDKKPLVYVRMENVRKKKICKLLSVSILFGCKSIRTSRCNYDFHIDYITHDALWEWAVTAELLVILISMVTGTPLFLKLSLWLWVV